MTKTKKFLFLSAACFALFSYGTKPSRGADTTPASAPIAATSVTGTVSTPSTVVMHNADGSTTTTTTTTYYVDYDTNRNGILDSKEFYSYAYRAWDLNRDGYISDAEWKAGMVRWYGTTPTEYRTYTYWDKNGDGRVDTTEFDTIASGTRLYSGWDVNADGNVDNDEYAAARFRIYDTNNDGSISMDEWKSAL